MTNYVHSFWSRSPIEQKFPSLSGKATADIVVVGGGMNGVCTAIALKEAGYDVVLIDREAIGAQSSTKNFGTLTTVWNYASIDQKDSVALVVYAEQKIADLHATLKKMGLGDDFQQENNWRIIKEAANVNLGHEEYMTAKNAGYDCAFIPAAEVKATSAQTFGAVRIKQWVVDPAKLMHDLRQLADVKGVRIHEFTPATRIVHTKDAVEIRTPTGKIVAGKVVICANGFTNSMGVDSLSHSLPIHIHALATRPLRADVAAMVGTVFGAATDVAPRSKGHEVYWQRLLPTGQLLFGGGAFSIPSGRDRLSPTMTDRKAQSLIDELQHRYPFLDAADVDCFWSGAITGPAGEKPVIADVGASGRITLVQSCFGHGMGLATAIGDAVVEHLRQGATRQLGPQLLLQFAEPTPSFMRWAEGFVFRLLANPPMRGIANTILAP